MSHGSGGGSNPVIQGAMTFLVGGLNALLNGPSAGEKIKSAVLKDAQGNNDFGYITSTTEVYAKTAFSNFFNYMYQGNESAPPNATSGGKIVGFDDILVWNEAAYSDSADIQAWINQQLGSSLPSAVIPALGENLAQLISTTFQLTNNSWQDVTKTYVIPFTLNGNSLNMGFDVLMVSSCAVDSNGNNPTGICRLVAVAYLTNAWEKK